MSVSLLAAIYDFLKWLRKLPPEVKHLLGVIERNPKDSVLSECKNLRDTIKSDFGWLLLQSAITRGDVDIIEELLKLGARYPTSHGSLLMNAANTNPGLVDYFLDRGEKVNATNSVGMTALIYAAVEGHTEVVQTLISRGADVNARNCEGRTALTYARRGRHEAVVKLLQDAGALG
jgi:uncharacterized protein